MYPSECSVIRKVDFHKHRNTQHFSERSEKAQLLYAVHNEEGKTAQKLIIKVLKTVEEGNQVLTGFSWAE